MSRALSNQANKSLREKKNNKEIKEVFHNDKRLWILRSFQEKMATLGTQSR